MEINQLPQWLESEFEFPLTRAALVDRAGERVIDAPTPTGSETIATILQRSGEERYRSRNDLVDAIRGNLSEEYVGRKYYDDRGSNVSAVDTGQRRDESF